MCSTKNPIFISPDVNECVSGANPCLNNGVCINTLGSVECDCSNTGYTGKTCNEGVWLFLNIKSALLSDCFEHRLIVYRCLR